MTSILPRPRSRNETRLDETTKEDPMLMRVHYHAIGETSRTIIRASQLRLLPDVHLWSIHQVVCLGS
jgi:hypothetical protein